MGGDSMVGGGNPNPTAGNNPAEYGTQVCGLCGAEVKKLPTHLEHHCPEAPSA